MIKLTFCLVRAPHLSREEFQRHWLERHGPLVRSMAPVLRIKRYGQSHTLTTPLNEAFRRGRGAPEAYDGVAEPWGDSLEDLTGGRAYVHRPRALAALAQRGAPARLSGAQ